MDKEQRRQKFLAEHPDFTYLGKWRIDNKKKYLSFKNWRKKYPLKIKAHRKVFVAIRNGTLKRKSCFCKNKYTQAHHEDYSKPLEVIWLCKKHHVIADEKRRRLDKSVIPKSNVK